MQQPILVAQQPKIAALEIGRRLAHVTIRFARRQPVGFVSALMILFLILCAVFAPLIAPYDATELGVGPRLASPSLDHLFGTDEKGRDIFSRVVVGARVSLQVGIIAVAIGVGSGSIIGLVSGYLGGKLDMVVQRIMDSLYAFPALVLAISLAAAMSPGMTTAMVAIGIVIMPSANRVIRGATMSVKENPYVEAARVRGATDLRIMAFHILPNVMAPILVLVSIVMGAAIIVEAALSFLGIGVQPPTPSWGQTLNQARPYMEDAPWLVLAPGGAIISIVLAFNLLGDALRDYLDPSLRQR